MSRAPGILLLLAVIAPMMMMMTINGQNPGTPDQNKCGSCPCGNPCGSSPPPPPPPPSPPPPNPPSSNCPPPPAKPKPPPYAPYPPSEYIYITGPPGSVYPIDSESSGAGRSSGTVGLTIFLMIMCSIFQLALLRT